MNQRKLFFRRIVAANLIMAMLASMNGPVNLKARHITNNYHSAEIITVDDIPNEYLYTRKEKGYFNT